MARREPPDDMRAARALCDALHDEDGVPVRRRSGRQRPRRRRLHRKRAQLCAQIERQVQMSLAADFGDLDLQGLVVASVEPWPDDACLLVTVYPEAGCEASRPELLARLESSAAYLRRQVAAGISRKRTPELRFQVIDRAQARDWLVGEDADAPPGEAQPDLSDG